MNSIETCLLLVAIPIGLLGTGYWLAASLHDGSATERLAAAMLIGLCVLLWTVSVVNLALPLSGIWGWVCFLPAALSVARTERRHALGRDLADVLFNRRGIVLTVVVGAFLAFLLWPLFSRPGLVFYDGTGNHDAFLWVTGAEHLKRQNYLQTPLADAVYPLYYSATAITGWRPESGRMGAEGLLALVSNLAGTSPLKLYVAATAALFLPWIAAVYLVVRTFVLTRVSRAAAVALVTLQPMFVFFHSNANLPNLIGMLCGATAVVAVARTMADSERRGSWWIVVALSVHGLLCSYPEILPAIVVPCGLLAARAWFGAGGRPVALRGLAVLGAGLAGLIMNPVTTLRAWHGFFSALRATQNPDIWPNIFASLPAPAIAPAMATLSVPFGGKIGVVGGAVCCGLLLAATVLAIRRARDRFGAVAILTGAAVMFAYTLETGFGYGWQKTMQFAAVFVAAILPIGAIGAMGDFRPSIATLRRPAWWISASVAVIFTGATIVNCLEAHKWSHRKYLTRDWFAARDFTRKTLRNAPVLVDTRAFPRPFFYTMWATYFLTDSRVYFSDADSGHGGGYLQDPVRRDAITPAPAPRAILVSSSWAERFHLPRRWASDTLVLVPGHARPVVHPQ